MTPALWTPDLYKYSTPTDLGKPEAMRAYMDRMTRQGEFDDVDCLTYDQIAALDPRSRAIYLRMRKDWHNRIIASTPSFTDIRKAISSAVLNGTGTYEAQESVLVAAPADAGKSTALLSAFRHVWKEEVDLRGPTTRTGDMRIPVVVLNTKSSKLQSTGLTHSWLDALGFPTNRSRDPLSRLVDVLESWETVAIAFEDAHRLDGTGTPGSSPVWETISCLDKRVDAAIVLSWTTEDDDVTVDGEMALSRGLQVESRSHHALTIPPLPAPKFDSRGDIRPSVIAGILKRLEMDLVLPNKVARDLTSPDVALALHDYSRGRVGRLKRAVVQMATRAMETGTERIDADIVRALLTGMPPVDVETRPSKRRRTAA